MKILKVGDAELDVSTLTGSDCYKLVEDLVICNAKVIITSDQVNSFALQKKESTHVVTKCYKVNCSKWVNKKYKLIELTKPTKTLALGINSAPMEATKEHQGIPYNTDYAYNLMCKRPEYIGTYRGRKFACYTEADLAFFMHKLNGPIDSDLEEL